MLELVDLLRGRARRGASLDATLEALGVPVRKSHTFAGQSVSTASALRHSVVWACVKHHADLISSFPVDVYRKKANGAREEVRPPAWTSKPQPDTTLTQWLWMVVASLELAGNAIGIITPGEDGWPVAVTLQDPATVSVRRDGEGRLVYKVGQAVVSTDLIWHVKGPVLPGQVMGLSTLAAAREAVGMGQAVDEYLARWFGDGAHPSAVLMTEKAVDEPQARTIKERFLGAIRGTREPVVLGLGMKYQPIQLSPADSAFLDVVNASGVDICRFFDVYPETVSVVPPGSKSVTYQNRQDRALDQLAHKTGPRLRRLEEALSLLVPRGQYVKLNPATMLATDTLTRYKAHDTALRAGWRSVNEIRRLEDEEPIGPDGDQFLWPPYSTAPEPTAPPTDGAPPDDDATA